ncbi:Ger(x)C family spore germination C-terminal domain-containing protein [Bacillus sp. FJAT-26390]|uniref:Ger(x)C family spore germination C-terminal domain-containing protein n=1 Tax=Bacillus sp. FJAT-26390 TaxID=1743142 RepID=UPI0009E557AB
MVLLKRLFSRFPNEVETNIQKSLQLLQKKYNTDVLGFGEQFRKYDSKQWSIGDA